MIDLDASDTGALLSPCRRWRYVLWRRWQDDTGAVAFIGLNPSTADELTDDPTIRRCRNFARAWGYGMLIMLNAYAYRATDPRVMKAAGANALGPLNNEYISQVSQSVGMVVAAWGAHCDPQREREVRALVGRTGRPLHHLGLTKGGHPKHPLYLPGDTQPQAWTPDPLAA